MYHTTHQSRQTVQTLYLCALALEVDLIISVSRYGNKYLKTKADGEHPDNLLALPECG